MRGVVPDKESQSPSCNKNVTFERRCQYRSLFGRLEADQRKVCELQQSGTAPLTFTFMTLSPRSSPSIFAYCKLSKTGGGNGLGTRLLVSPHSSLSSLQIVFPKGAHYALPDLATCGYEVVGIDWTIDPLVAR